MNKFAITDSCCDLPLETFKFNEAIDYVPLSFEIGGNIYIDNFGQDMSFTDFYNKISQGALPKTSQATPKSFYETFKKYIVEGEPILYIGLSSGLSGTFNSSQIAREMIMSDYPNARIELFDTLSVSTGEGLFVLKAIELRNEGRLIDYVMKELNNKKVTQKSYFTVSDLEHLKRGGRLSPIQSAFGKILKINPMLSIDNKGKLNVVEKIRGKNKAMNRLFEYIKDNAKPGEIIAIQHSNCVEDAIALKYRVETELNMRNVMIGNIGTVIGSHVGIGCVAVLFLN